MKTLKITVVELLLFIFLSNILFRMIENKGLLQKILNITN